MVKIFGSCLLLLPISYFIYNTIKYTEKIKTVVNINDENCKVINGAVGIEDLVKFDDYYIGGSDDRGKLCEQEIYLNKKTPDGKLVLISGNKFNNFKINELPILNFPTEVAFHPHGLYLYKNKYLYVINHAYHKGGERVEKLEISYNLKQVELKYLKSFIYDDSLAGTLNDLVVIGDNDEIVITSFLPIADSVENGRKQDTLSKLVPFLAIGFDVKLTNSYYCFGSDCTKIPNTSSLQNNGITFDGKDKLYIVHLLEKKVRVMKINSIKGNSVDKFEFEKDIDTGYAIDNVEYDFDRDVITAGIIGKIDGHIKALSDYIKHGKFGNHMEWFGSLEIDVKNNNLVRLTTMQNRYFNGVSCAVRKGDYVIHGSWGDEGLLICKIR